MPILVNLALWPVDSVLSYSPLRKIVIEKITLLLCPSSLAILVGAGWNNSAMYIQLVIEALAINAILYAVVGAAIWYGITKSYIWLILPVLGVGALWGWLLTL